MSLADLSLLEWYVGYTGKSDQTKGSELNLEDLCKNYRQAAVYLFSFHHFTVVLYAEFFNG